jgi:hypothetical protein
MSARNPSPANVGGGGGGGAPPFGGMSGAAPGAGRSPSPRNNSGSGAPPFGGMGGALSPRANGGGGGGAPPFGGMGGGPSPTNADSSPPFGGAASTNNAGGGGGGGGGGSPPAGDSPPAPGSMCEALYDYQGASFCFCCVVWLRPFFLSLTTSPFTWRLGDPNCDLSFRKGQQIRIVKAEAATGWWSGELEGRQVG